MQKALQLAKKGEGFVSPNPLVGAVIVKNNKIISKGYHKACGAAHAEIEAIKKAKQSLKGSTLYVNLEPCCHFGRTPPCVDEIIKHKIKRVVIANIDPNPLVKGRSITKLRRAGIKVETGLLKPEGRQLNQVFFKNMEKKLPFVVAKLAQSLDGRTTTRSGASKWITNPSSRRLAKSLRDKYDAVLVGVTTIVKDDPGLVGLRRKPLKVVIDPDLRISPKSKIIKENPQKVIIFSSLAVRKKARRFPAKVKIIFLRLIGSKFNPKVILRKLYELGISSVFIEGGSKTLEYFFDARLIDKSFFFISTKIIGGRDCLKLDRAPYLREVKIQKIKGDFLIYGYPSF